MALLRNRPSRRAVIASLMAAPAILRAPALLAAPGPDTFVLAFHVTISPAWFDPSSAPPQITPFGVLYALHDALVRAYPGTNMGPALAESWQESEDGLTYEFKLRPNLTFHNGDPLTTEDVKFSFDRYQGPAPRVEGEGGGGRNRRSAHDTVSSEGDLARFHVDVRQHRHRGRPRRTEKLHREGRRRRFQAETDRRRSLQIRQHHAGRRGGVRSLRLLAQEAEYQECRVAQRPRCDYAGADGQDRRGRHRRRAGRRRARG